jgi:cell wall-associated NlpC family hydrolase
MKSKMSRCTSALLPNPVRATALWRKSKSIARALAMGGALCLAVPGGEAAAQTSMARTMANAADASAEVVLRALSLLGVPYRYGGNTPNTGLDCSGLVKLVFQETVGLALPRRSDDMSRFGQSVGWTDLQPGDLVFFNTMRHAFSHVGIYLGDNRFVHSPRPGKAVRVEDMRESYWIRRYNGARRLSED